MVFDKIRRMFLLINCFSACKSLTQHILITNLASILKFAKKNKQSTRWTFFRWARNSSFLLSHCHQVVEITFGFRMLENVLSSKSLREKTQFKFSRNFDEIHCSDGLLPSVLSFVASLCEDNPATL